MTYSEDQLTGWFDVAEQKPWEIGVYEVEIRGYTRDKDSAFAFFDGKEFCQPCIIGFGYVEQSKTWQNNAGHRVYKWRGLSQDPNAKPKRSGNKRKVMYVVAHKATRCAEAVFSKKKNAQEYAKHLTFSVYITKIRFRTPEHN